VQCADKGYRHDGPRASTYLARALPHPPRTGTRRERCTPLSVWGMPANPIGQYLLGRAGDSGNVRSGPRRLK
jgi:hypothetical protein